MTRDQFAAAYAARSKVAIEQLLGYGLRFVECACGADNCNGWQTALPRTDPNVTDEQWERADAWADRYLART
jgi:hypothetical protein